MATNILSNQSLATEQIVYSDEMTNIYDADFQAIPSNDAEGRVRFTLQRATANGAYRDAKDTNGQVIQFETNGTSQEGVNISGINAAKACWKVEIFKGGKGTLNLEYESI